jgi:hypothetical protein
MESKRTKEEVRRKNKQERTGTCLVNKGEVARSSESRWWWIMVIVVVGGVGGWWAASQGYDCRNIVDAIQCLHVEIPPSLLGLKLQLVTVSTASKTK